MKIYESKDYDWQKPEVFSFWEWVEPLEVRSIALQLLVNHYKLHSYKDGDPSELYVEGLREGLNACAAAGTLDINAPRVRSNQEYERKT